MFVVGLTVVQRRTVEAQWYFPTLQQVIGMLSHIYFKVSQDLELAFETDAKLDEVDGKLDQVLQYFEGVPVGPNQAPVEQTGQEGCWEYHGVFIACAGTGQDGEYQEGVAPPVPRFTDNGDGTVTDNLTELIWLKNANCFSDVNWETALDDANALAEGSCGLTDSSVAGEWRLPNVKELQSLTDFSEYEPALPAGHPFSGVEWSHYWSATTRVFDPSDAWTVNLGHHLTVPTGKGGFSYFVWPVRGGP